MNTSTTIMSMSTGNDTTNNSDLPARMPMWLAVICFVCAVIISVTAICGNALVLAAFVRFRSKVFSVYNVFALFLALADLTVGLLTVPLSIWYDLYYDVSNSTAAKVLFLEHAELCFLETFFDFVPIILSLTTLFLMGIERCIAVCAPSKHVHIRPWHAVVVCGLVWTAFILTFSIDMIVNHDDIKATVGLRCDHISPGVNSITTYIGVALFFLSWLLYGVIFVKLCSNHRNVNINNSRRVTKMTIFILTAFTIAYLPLIIVIFLLDILPPVFSSSLSSVALLILYANSAVNPFIYNKASDAFRSAFRKLLCLKTSTTHVEKTEMSKTDFQEKEDTTKL